MGASSSKPSTQSGGAAPVTPTADAAAGGSRPKPCCACPETRKARDECVITHGEDDARCVELIKAHQDCMRKLGFNI